MGELVNFNVGIWNLDVGFWSLPKAALNVLEAIDRFLRKKGRPCCINWFNSLSFHFISFSFLFI